MILTTTVAQLEQRYAPEDRSKVFISHLFSGDLGDIVYYIPVIRYLYSVGFVNVFNYIFEVAAKGQRTFLNEYAPCFASTALDPVNIKQDCVHDYGRYSFRYCPAEASLNLERLNAELQHQLANFHEVKWVETLDSAFFRTQLPRIQAERKDPHLSLSEYQLLAHGVTNIYPEDGTSPLLVRYFKDIHKGRFVNDNIVFSFSGRYMERSSRFMCMNNPADEIIDGVLSVLKGDNTLMFVGLESEYLALSPKSRQRIRHFRTPGTYEVLNIVSTAKLFVGNQSFPFSIAQFAGIKSVLLESPTVSDSIVGRSHYWDILKKQIFPVVSDSLVLGLGSRNTEALSEFFYPTK